MVHSIPRSIHASHAAVATEGCIVSMQLQRNIVFDIKNRLLFRACIDERTAFS